MNKFPFKVKNNRINKNCSFQIIQEPIVTTQQQRYSGQQRPHNQNQVTSKQKQKPYK